MKVSTKSEHALHAMLFISAMNNRVCSINEISEEEKIPRAYLAKVLRELAIKGLLKSTKGIYGGYVLSKAPQKISFLNIIEAMDGPLMVVTCASDTHLKKSSKRKYCAGQVFWIPLQDRLKETLASMTLDKLL